MDVFTTYTIGSAGWLITQAVPLILAPSILSTALFQEPRHPTPLEIYLARSLGFALTLIATTLLFFTGSVPLSSSITEPVSLEDSDPKAPYAVPLLRVTSTFHALMAVYCYVTWMGTYSGTVPFLLGALGYGVFACMGFWAIMFGTEKGRISKRTGADKRTTGFPFKNSQAYDKKRDKRRVD